MLVCKKCGYKQYDEETIAAMKAEYPDIEEHDISYVCGACQNEEENQTLKVCERCLMAIESREGNQPTLKFYPDEENEEESKCMWCEETGFDVLFEIIG